jgi:NTF2 fold immunity protein of polymorphic toxin system component/ClpA/ClpB-like protein
MFERFTEKARRVIFFARFEASQFGSTTIETEHLLLGLLREGRNLMDRFLPAVVPSKLREEISARLEIREKVSTSIDLPLSQECRRILAHSTEEADRLRHPEVGIEHFLLGMLREEKCGAAQILFQHGLKLDTVREELSQFPMPPEATATLAPSGDLRPFSGLMQNPALPKAGVVSDAETATRIAEAIWIPLFGEETVNSQKPFNAELRFNIWIVTGSAPPETAMYIFLLQTDGRVFSVHKGKPSQ